jgi:hypothetical protein
MVALFSLTIFIGSGLLFLLQPMFARMVLPLLGGSPSVWNAAMAFYQAMLLAGYAYAHGSVAGLGAARQAGVHVAVLLLPLLVLPIGIPSGWLPPTDTSPLPWLMALMAAAVGLPFFAVATMSPTLQKWFSATGHPRAEDPYFLYSASNLGSMAALLAYPVLIEPVLPLASQARLWSWGYLAFVALAIACGCFVWRRNRAGTAGAEGAGLAGQPAERVEAAGFDGAGKALSPRRRLRWVALSFVPSSLMLGVTSFLTSEVAVVPLLWIAPLAIYLLTFVLAFQPGAEARIPVAGRGFAILIVTLVVAINMRATQPLGWLMVLHLTVFGLGAFCCHTRLAADRPSATHLTEFYLWLSVGGVLGGVFNALLAPLLFSGFAEYPLALVFAALFATTPRSTDASPRARLLDWLAPLAIGGLAVGLVVAVQAFRPGLESSLAFQRCSVSSCPAGRCGSPSDLRRCSRPGLSTGEIGETNSTSNAVSSAFTASPSIPLAAIT